MKWKKIYLPGIIALTSLSVHAPPMNIEKKLASVEVFSMGFNGFIAKKMPEQLIYEEALENKNSDSIFKKVIENPDSTPESKAYAACGLWKKNLLNDINPDEILMKKMVTVLRGDILQRESLGSIIHSIKIHGCH
ncbi:MchS3 family protein [Pantoea coffeiphila]|uniref:MchS3 family protein n=1 Tax=Pantoea coffeiphila TaxID=1465635 RepID=UPI001960024C|nr:MchS3 family protein [Pantoea coffeiphila]MBM7341195.1 hypothetical protein [Pantoea coffeiphila]